MPPKGWLMDRTTYESRLKNLHSWSGHLWSTLEEALPRAIAELGPPGDETSRDVRNAAEALHAVAEGLADVMGAYDLLLESTGRTARYGDFLQRLQAESAEPAAVGDEDDGPSSEISRTQYARLAAELCVNAGWLIGAVHGAMTCGEEGHIDGHLDALASGIEELMISYDRLQDLIGVMPMRHCAFFDQIVVLEEERRRRRRNS